MKHTDFIDLHTHTLFSDGVLLPFELVVRAKTNGYKAIAITDHGDLSTLDFVLPRITKAASMLTKYYHIETIPGIELTYIPPVLMKEFVKKARKLGAQIVVVHGETPVEPVPAGTNHAAILSGADVLAHPGYITEEDVKLAKKTGICLEITTRNGHNKGNLHVAKLAKKYDVKLVLNTDSHAPENLLTESKIKSALKMSGLSDADYKKMYNNSLGLIKKHI